MIAALAGSRPRALGRGGDGDLVVIEERVARYRRQLTLGDPCSDTVLVFPAPVIGLGVELSERVPGEGVPVRAVLAAWRWCRGSGTESDGAGTPRTW